MVQSIIATTIIFAVLFLILSSLGFGLFYLLTDQKGGKRTFRALSVRVTLSMLFFLGLILSIYLGWITPNPPLL